jgi:hypothetical protein
MAGSMGLGVHYSKSKIVDAEASQLQYQSQVETPVESVMMIGETHWWQNGRIFGFSLRGCHIDGLEYLICCSQWCDQRGCGGGSGQYWCRGNIAGLQGRRWCWGNPLDRGGVVKRDRLALLGRWFLRSTWMRCKRVGMSGHREWRYMRIMVCMPDVG